MARSVFAKRDGLVIWPIKEGKLVGLPQCTSLVSVKEGGRECVTHWLREWGDRHSSSKVENFFWVSQIEVFFNIIIFFLNFFSIFFFGVLCVGLSKNCRSKMSMKSRGWGGETTIKNVISRNLAFLLCLFSFFAGIVFTNR